MTRGRLLIAATAAILAAILVLGLGGSYSLDCGPLDRPRCDERAREIVSLVSREYAQSRVFSIVILDLAGHATVLLRDGTRLDVVDGRVTEQMVWNDAIAVIESGDALQDVAPIRTPDGWVRLDLVR